MGALDVDAESWLVEEEQLGVAEECAADGESAFYSAGVGANGFLGAVAELD
ncbi:hypothetical protein V3M49_07115 [Trueperella pyogenes]